MRLRHEIVLTMFFIQYPVQADAQKRKSWHVLFHEAILVKAVAILQPKLLEVKAAKNYPNDNIHYILKRSEVLG
jgi:hypothetical protein